MNRFISSNRWVSPWIARDNGLKSATISVFIGTYKTQVAGRRSQVAGRSSQVAGHRSQVTGQRSASKIKIVTIQ